MAREQKEIKKITAGSIFSWIFGVLFLFAGMSLIALSSYVTGILVIICSAMIIPYFNKISAEKFNFQMSGGVKFILVIVIFVLMGMGMSNSGDFNSNVNVQPTDNVINQNTQTQPSQNTQTTTSKQKVKSATLSIDRVQIQLANLYPTRITVINTGDVPISPKFDLYVYDSRNNEVCSGSPLFDEFRSILAGQKQTGELILMGCMFEKDGSYTLRIDLLDSDYNKLDSANKEFLVDYWGKFGLG